jgi:hypothetical protein
MLSGCWLHARSGCKRKSPFRLWKHLHLVDVHWNPVPQKLLAARDAQTAVVPGAIGEARRSVRNIACKHEEASTQRVVRRCIQSPRTTGDEISHSIDMQVACACADVRCSQTTSLFTNRGGPSYSCHKSVVIVGWCKWSIIRPSPPIGRCGAKRGHKSARTKNPLYSVVSTKR